MLGSLARKLRIYGFDAIYDAKLDDRQLIRIAESQDRTLLTSDRDLFVRATNRNISTVLITGNSDTERLAFVFGSLKITVSLDPDNSRCPVCNGLLKETLKSSLTSIPADVLKRQQKFYVCKECGKVYWQGGHWSRMKSMAAIVRKTVQT
ncbi:MAG: hypothetical protein FJ358_00305 [Thaumarchaeota archaeon]|nr:hypothetical protein [Nitrososphaerota archaeon]